MSNENKFKKRSKYLLLSSAIAMASIPVAGFSSPNPVQIQPESPNIVKVEAKTDIMAWNAVAVSQGRIFVAGPRWTGFPGPAVGIIDPKGEVIPFPDKKWNDWTPEKDAANYFVCVNAIHLGPNGSLWVVDSGAPAFGKPIVPNGPKLVKINPKNGDIQKVYLLGADVIHNNSYINDIRFNPKNDLAYITDTGSEAVIVFDTKDGHAWRVLEGHPSTLAQKKRPIIADGKQVDDKPGQALSVAVDPLEVSPDGKWLYYGPAAGPWSKVPTALIDNSATSAKDIAASVRPWVDLPPIGGTAMDEKGNFYFTSLKDNSIYRRSESGKTVRIFTDPLLHWGDALMISEDKKLWVPVPQIDRLPQFHQGKSFVKLPIILVSINLKEWEKNKLDSH